MNRVSAIAALLAGLALSAAAGAATSDYPIDDPLAATIVGTPADMRADLPTDLPQTTRELAPLTERATPPALNYARPLEYTLTVQNGPAPLAFIVTGTGAGAKGAKSDLLARALYAEGYHVVALPSPTSVGFMLGAASHPVPGRTSQDVADLYRLMRAVRDDLGSDIAIDGYALAGYSLGGLQAAYVAQRDDTEQAFGFSRVLLINPAVDLYRSVRRMDRLLATGLKDGIAGLPRFLERALGKFRSIYAGGEPVEFNEDFLYRAYLAADTQRDDIAATIGLAFRLWLANMNFAADLLSDSGVIVPPDRQPSPTDSLEQYLVGAFSMSFTEYMDKLLLPYYNRDGRSLSREQLIAEGQLRSIAGYLAGAEHVGVITNADEIILDQAEVAFLRETFGDRATVFENGGHMGNLAHRDVIRVVRAFFRQ